MSYAKDFTLSYTQCKQLVANVRDLREFLEDVTTNQPEFIKSMGTIDSIYGIRSIQDGGCASGAYMPAVTYYTAVECMNEHYSEIEDILEDAFCGNWPVFDISKENWRGFAVKLVSMAVEVWVNRFDLENVNWD